MLVDFPYPGYEAIAPAEIPDHCVLGVFTPQTMDGGDEQQVLARALAEPIGAPPLHSVVGRRDRVLVLVDDATRGTPVARVLPHVIAELEAAGVPDHRILLLTSQGTHRAMTNPELRQKLGALSDRFTVHQHDWLDTAALHDYGCLSDGTRVTANRLLTQADCIIGIGSIVPHRIKGFSGGAKIAFPGVAGREIQERNQWEAASYRAEDVMGAAENPMRRRIEEAARLIGLRYIVNCVLDGSGRLAGCFAGDIVLAHRRGCVLARRLNEVVLPHRADVVLADSYPADRDVWQSAKAVYSGGMAVREGGTLIIVAPNPEGVADNHPVLLEIGYRRYSELARLVQEGRSDDVVALAVLANLAQVMDRVEVILVSPGVRPDEAVRIGFQTAETVQQAIARALARHGADTRVAVLRQGGRLLPRVSGTAANA